MLRAKAGFKDGQCAAHKRLGLGETVGISQQPRKVVEFGCHMGVVVTQACLINGQSAAHERLGFGQAVTHLEQLCQIVQADGYFGALRA